MSNTPVSHRPGQAGTTPQRETQDDKRGPLQPQAPLSGAITAEPESALASQPALRDRVRKREVHEAGEAAPLSHKRLKAQVDYARLDSGQASDDEGSLGESEDVLSSPRAAPGGAIKRKERKSEGSDGEVEQENAGRKKEARPDKRRKAARPKAKPLPMDGRQPVAELGRLLGLQPGWDRPASSSSSSPYSSSALAHGPGANQPANDVEPAIDAETLAQTLRQAYAKNVRGVGNVCKALDAIVPSLQLLPPRAFEVATRAIGQLAGYRPTACEHVAAQLCSWCEALGGQGEVFAQMLTDEMGVRLYQGSTTRTARRTVIDELLCKAPRPATAQVWKSVLCHSFDNEDTHGIDRIILQVVEHGRNAEAAQQFFQCLGALCRDHAVSAERLCEMVGPLIGAQARASAGDDAATRVGYLRAAFTSFCNGLWAHRLNRAQHNELVMLWLSEQRRDELLARQRVMAPALCERRPPPNFSTFVEAALVKFPEFRPYGSLVISTFAHLLRAAKDDVAEREALAQVLPRSLDFLLNKFSRRECAELMRTAARVLSSFGEDEPLEAFFSELLSQIHRLGMLAPDGGGRALISRALSTVAEFPQVLDGYCMALTEFALGIPAPMLRQLAQLGGESVTPSMAPVEVEKRAHTLLQPIFKKYATMPGLPMGPLVEGFVGALIGRIDLEQRLGRFVNGLAQGLAAEDGAAARTIGHAMAVGLGGAAIGAESMDACMAALMPRLRLLHAHCVSDFIEGLVDGLGGTSLPLDRVRQITLALHEARAQADGELHANESQARVTLRAQLGTQRFNEALALTQRPGDLPAPASAAAPLGSASTQIAALRAAVDQLGAPPELRPPLSEVCAHDREAARLWLALASEHRSLHLTAASSQQAALQAEIEAALADLQAHLPAPQAGLTPESVAQHVKQFQRRDSTGIDPVARTQEALVLGWRLGLGRETDTSQPLARAALAQRAQRLFQLATPPATGAGFDPIVTGLLHAATRPRHATAANAPLMQPLLECAIDTVARREAPSDVRERLPLIDQVATAAEWIVRSAAGVVRPDEVAAAAAARLWTWADDDFNHVRHWARSETERPTLAVCVARGVDARNNEGALEKLIQAAHRLNVIAGPTARGLSEVIGRGGPLQEALRFAAALPGGVAQQVEHIVTGLCHHVAPADVLFKAARDFSPAQKAALLRQDMHINTSRSYAQHLAAPPPEPTREHPQRHPRDSGGPGLTVPETREWAMAWAIAKGAAHVSDLGVLRADFDRPAPAANPGASSGPADLPAEDAQQKKACLDALEFVKDPSYLIRTMTASDMSAPRQLAWLDLLYGDKRRMTREFTLEQLSSFLGMPQNSLTQAERALRLESVLTLVRHGAEHLDGVHLRSIRNFMLEQLRAMQADLVLQEDGQPSAEYTELYLKTSQAVTALYTPAVYARAMKLQWAFKMPGPGAPAAETEAFLAKAKEARNAILPELTALRGDIEDIEARLAHETGRTEKAAELLALRADLDRLQPPPAQAAAWRATLDGAVLDLKRSALLRETLGQLRAAMGALRSTLEAVVEMATQGAGPAAAGIPPPPMQPVPEVEGLG